MSETIVKVFKKSSINAVVDFDFYQLERKSEFLLDCKIEKEMDEFKFLFTTENEKPFSDVKELSLSAKYRTLINIQYLFQDAKRLNISLQPNNLLVDLNMMPKAIMRDIHESEFQNSDDFINQYKSLIGYVLQNRYSFQEFYEGGNQLLGKNKVTAIYKDNKSVDEIVATLYDAYNNYQETIQTTMIEVDKKKYKRSKITNKLLLVLFLCSIAIGGYFGGFKLLELQSINKANEAFIKQDYISVIETLKSLGIDQMNTNTKYILAISDIKTESLNEEQKNNILSGITLISDNKVLEFWVYLAKSDMDKAIDIAKQLGNKEYIAFGYMKQKEHVTNDASLSGSEREQKIKEIESSLNELNINTNDKDSTKTKDNTTNN